MRKRIFALIMALVMIFAMTSVAMADTTLDANGEQGAFTDPDTPISQTAKTVVLSKCLVGYNATSTKVMAPDIKYAYRIDPATVSELTVTDAANKHRPQHMVTAPVKAGVGAPSITANVAWTPAEELNTDTQANGGAANKKDISIDFSNVVFSGAGVYRYKVTESLADGYTYATSGVTKDANETQIRYVDVYVRPKSNGFTDGTTAAEWDIYGFTCFANNESITDGNKATVAVKTTGFVGLGNGTRADIEPDSYYTYDLLITKTVANDAYGAQHSDFPFTVIFTNTAITTQVDIIGSANDNSKATGFVNPDKQAFATVAGITDKAIAGIVTLKDGGTVTFVGIPSGTNAEVYETNDESGVTYTVSTTINNGTAVVDSGVISGTTPDAPVAQSTTKAAYESTKATATTTANEYVDAAYDIQVTNTLETISPTGVILRYAPYMLILVGGALLLIFGWKLLRRMRKEEEVA